MLIPSLLALLAASPLAPQALWDAWPAQRFVKTPAPCIRHTELVERLKALHSRHRGRLRLEEVGRSFEGRSIHLLTVGAGPRKVLLWSQMHGDEPSATPALLDVADFLLSQQDLPDVRAVLDKAMLLMIPMLNPDGAARYQRRNAQGIDVNRDALSLATPEGRLLKSIRDRHQPELGFNLHDQNRRTTVGDTGTLSTIALLAVAGDPKGTMTTGRARAKRACAAVTRALEPFVRGGIARYDEDWSPRAFGDNLTAWGTPVVLIESGGVPQSLAFRDLTRLNFVALLSVLGDLVKDDLEAHHVDRYDSLKRNQSGSWSDVLIQGGLVLQPGTAEPYRADIAFDALRGDLLASGCSGAERRGSRITELGDARFLSAGRRVDATGSIVTAGFVASVHGLAARKWLSIAALDALGRLGVTALRWHVGGSEVGEATRLAQERNAEGRPPLTVIAGRAREAWLRLERPPAAAHAGSLAHALDALSGPRWRSRAGARGLGALIGLLAGLPENPSGVAPVRLAPDAAASLVLLRSTVEGRLDPDTVRIESVWIEGVEARK